MAKRIIEMPSRFFYILNRAFFLGVGFTIFKGE